MGTLVWALQCIGTGTNAAQRMRGVGTGSYMPSVRAIGPDSRPVHNVSLLVTAELGLLSAALLFWLTFSALRTHPAALAPWVAMLIIGAFDNTLRLKTSWRAAIIVGLIVAHASATDRQQRQTSTQVGAMNQEGIETRGL